MKNSILILALVVFAATFASCRDADPEPETVVIEKEVIKDEPEQVVQEDESLLEEAAEEVDNEIEEEVSEEIQQIGDDK